MKADAEEWIRLPTGEEPNDEFSRSPSQRHRSRPRLQSPDSNLDRSSDATETAASTASGTLQPFATHHGSSTHWKSPGCLVRSYPVDYDVELTQRVKCHCLLFGRIREMWTICRYVTPWRTPQARNSQSSQAMKKPSLPPPRPAGPCPAGCFDPPPPPAEEVTHHPPGRRCGGGAASSSGPSTPRTSSNSFAIETVPCGCV